MAKPTKIPRWADVGGSIVEPASGKKDIGWVSDEKPPAQWFNWWQNVVGDWFTWLDDFFFDGPASGDLEVTGLDVAAGTDVDGGDLALSGGSSTGSGSSTSEMKAAVAGVTGVTVRPPETFLKADGLTERIVTPKSFESINSAPTVTDTNAIVGVGNGTGEGVKGTGGVTDGHGVQGTAGGGGHGIRGVASGEDNTSVGVRGAGNTGGAATSSVGVYGTGSGTAAIGVRGTGAGTGDGVYGNASGEDNASIGVHGVGSTTGAATGSIGVKGEGAGTGVYDAIGVYGRGGAASGIGVYGHAIAGNSNGVEGKSSGNGAGVYGTTNGNQNAAFAIHGVADVSGSATTQDAIKGEGAGTAGTGVEGVAAGAGDGVVGGATSGAGVEGTATTGQGGSFSATTGRGVYSTNASGTNKAGEFINTGAGGGLSTTCQNGKALSVIGDLFSPVQAALYVAPQSAQPTGANSIGDMYVTSTGVLKICTVAGTPGTWVSVGAQT